MNRSPVAIKSFQMVLGRAGAPLVQKEYSTTQTVFGFDIPNTGSQLHGIVWQSEMTGSTSAERLKQAGEHVFILGDGQDFDASGGMQFVGNGVVLRISSADRKLEVCTSITGLPAVFVYQGEKVTVVASSIDEIASVPGVQLQFDPKGLAEHATIGHPINHRTLFRNVSLVPAGARLKLVETGQIEIVDKWVPPAGESYLDWPSYIEAQISAMKAAVRRLDISRSFLSLTAGLDTRAIFSLLVQAGVHLPAFTMSGVRESLDAMRAKQLCHAYGWNHNNVSIDAGYIEGLPACAAEASRLSGGLGSLGQAFEVYFYKSVPAGLTARISGNLGNQIGRSGTEGTGSRGASLEILAPDLRAEERTGAGSHWFNEIFPDQQMMHPLFLIQNENLYASLGNYCIGSRFAVQQTPYADRTVIAQKLHQPSLPDQNDKQDAIWRIKLRDLRHRILGQPVEYSFQRRIVRDTGGFVASCPINWGWRARGGVSLAGLVYGGMALTDAVLGSRLGRYPVASRIMGAVGINGFSGFQASDVLGKTRIKEFIADLLLSGAARQSGVLNAMEIDRIVDSGVSEPQHRSSVEFAIDVALAKQNFLSPG